jgi:hypothetical protein
MRGRLGGDLAQVRRGQARQRRDARAQAGLEVELALHRPPGDRRDLVAAPGPARQLVDDLHLDERGVHVHRHQPLAAAAQALALHRDVEARGLGQQLAT